MVNNSPCPCGSKQNYQQCCQVFHNGTAAATAEQLMRSRYSAYHFGLLDYLKTTWHTATLPQHLFLENDIKWIRLKIIASENINASDATVHFIATYKQAGKAYKLEENSQFKRHNGKWLYLKAKT